MEPARPRSERSFSSPLLFCLSGNQPVTLCRVQSEKENASVPQGDAGRVFEKKTAQTVNDGSDLLALLMISHLR